MKKLVLFALLFSAVSCAYAQEEFYQEEQTEKQEIYLDLKTPSKQYNLNKPDYRNNPDLDNKDDYDDGMPIMPTSPLRMLQQYNPNY